MPGSAHLRRFDSVPLLSILIGLVCLPCLRPAYAETGELPARVEELIQNAGNTNDDVERLAILETLQQREDLDVSLQKDVDRIVTEIDRWVNGRSMIYFSSQLIKRQDYNFGIKEDSPVYPLTLLYRGRMIIRVMCGYGGYWGTADKRRPLYNRARSFFRGYLAKFPENDIAAMYLGKMIPPTKEYPSVPSAPAWAADQRESLERLADVITWWIDNRMQEDGQYGGGWADDCEMWRWWVPVLIGFDDPHITAAQARFSRALMSQKHMQGGYTTHVYDVEHTAEDSADAITPMMFLEPDNTEWQQRALRLVDLMENFWTGRNERGLLQFKSTYFSVDKIDPTPERACDTVYHPRTVQPALLYWQRTGDERLGSLFRDWMTTWVDAAAREERGKAAGIIPTAIHWPDGNIGGLGETWFQLGNHGRSELYDWPSAMTMMTNTLLLTAHMTGDDTFLEPIRSMAAMRLHYLKERPSKPPHGSPDWCASQLRRFGEVAAKYKFLTGSSEFDELIALEESSSYNTYRFTGNRQPLEAALRQTAAGLRLNFPGYTSEVRYTDRILMTPRLFQDPFNLAEPDHPVFTPDPAMLYMTVTGDLGDAGYFPLSAVRWLTPPRDIAALVTDAGRDRFSAELFHFGSEPRPMEAELYLLSPGTYRLTLEPLDDQSAQPPMTSEVKVAGKRTRISFTLPPQQTYSLRVQPD